MAKKSARRNGGAVCSTKSQRKRRKRLQYFNFAPKMAQRTNIEGWDDSLSLKANYKNLGIAYDANAVMSTPNEAFAHPIKQLVPNKNGIMTERLEYLQSLPPPAPYEVKSMNVQEQYQLQRLIQAHQDNYEAMQNDIKLNPTQSTARQLQKRIELMFRLQQLTNDDYVAEGDEEDDIMDELNAEFDDKDIKLDAFDEDEDEEDEEDEEEEQLEKEVKKAKQATAIKNKIHSIDVTHKFKKEAAKGIIVPKLSQLKLKKK